MALKSAAAILLSAGGGLVVARLVPRIRPAWSERSVSDFGE